MKFVRSPRPPLGTFFDLRTCSLLTPQAQIRKFPPRWPNSSGPRLAEHASSTCAAESEKGGVSSEARHLGGSRRAGHTDAVPAHPPHTLHRFAGQNQKPRKTRKQGARAVPAPQNKACFPEHASSIYHADSETGENSSVAMSSGRSSHAGHTDPAPLPPNTLPRFAQKIWKLSETSRSQENMLPRFAEEVQKQVQTIWSAARTKARRPPSQQRKACEAC